MLAERDALPMPLKRPKATIASDVKASQVASHHALVARPKDAEVTAAGGELAGKVADFKISTGANYRIGNTTTGGDNNGGRRQLQICTDGSSIFITSSEFPILEGCLSETEIFAGGEIEYITESGLGFIYAAEPDGMTEVLFCVVCVGGGRGSLFAIPL